MACMVGECWSESQTKELDESRVYKTGQLMRGLLVYRPDRECAAKASSGYEPWDDAQLHWPPRRQLINLR